MQDFVHQQYVRGAPVMIINLLLSAFPSAPIALGRLDAWTWRRNALGIWEMVQMAGEGERTDDGKPTSLPLNFKQRNIHRFLGEFATPLPESILRICTKVVSCQVACFLGRRLLEIILPATLICSDLKPETPPLAIKERLVLRGNPRIPNHRAPTTNLAAVDNPTPTGCWLVTTRMANYIFLRPHPTEPKRDSHLPRLHPG